MRRPAVLQWDKVIHKSVRRDREPIVYMTAEVNRSIIMQASRLQEYLTPKLHIKGFDGSRVYLDFSSGEQDMYGCSNILTFSKMNWKGATS